ncbi:MAG: glycosyltransferase family 4 protein [Anaerolineae bacterium]|nr:glycosyltransferase family 4 protein [Anaerolineae bacterium]
MLFGIDASRAVDTERTGTEAYAYRLITALLPLAEQRGHHVRLYSNGPLPAALQSVSPRITPVVMPFPRLWTHVRLGAELHRRPPDLFFTPAHVIPASYRGPAVATVHDLGYLAFPKMHTRRQRLYLDWSTRHNVRRSRVVLADSRATRDDVVRLMAASPEKVAVVYPGKDPTLQRVTDSAEINRVCTRYGIIQPYCLHIGTIQPRKNLTRLITAFGQIAAHIPHNLVLAGKAGWMADPIRDTLDQLPSSLRQRIILTGYMADEDKAALLSGAAALLFPSLYEGFGFPVVEAQQCGTPVLCADSSSLPEIAGDGALTVNPLDVAALADGIGRIVADTALQANLIAAGQRNVQRFDWQQSAERTLDLLEKAAT